MQVSIPSFHRHFHPLRPRWQQSLPLVPNEPHLLLPPPASLPRSPCVVILILILLLLLVPPLLLLLLLLRLLFTTITDVQSPYLSQRSPRCRLLVKGVNDRIFLDTIPRLHVQVGATSLGQLQLAPCQVFANRLVHVEVAVHPPNDAHQCSLVNLGGCSWPYRKGIIRNLTKLRHLRRVQVDRSSVCSVLHTADGRLAARRRRGQPLQVASGY
mmetsp:Transcript_5017/g.16196  ORF Transcript_5017/g.16196 Transcript_5017/m.16196 type:complete len:213 (+) Transcript_5017:290-928(+)